MKFISGRAVGTALIAGLALAAQAGAHAEIGPSLIQKDSANAFTLMVPTEEKAPTVSVELDVPDGFQIGGFEDVPGVKRDVVATGTGDEAKVSKVTWSGLRVPAERMAFLRFAGEITGPAKDYVFKVRQTYANGKIVEWAGPEGSDNPAPVVTVKDSLGDSGTDTLAIVALILGGIALLVAISAFVSKSGRPLT